MTKDEMRKMIAKQTKVFCKSKAIEILEPQENAKIIVKTRKAYNPTVDRTTNRKPKTTVYVPRPDQVRFSA